MTTHWSRVRLLSLSVLLFSTPAAMLAAEASPAAKQAFLELPAIHVHVEVVQSGKGPIEREDQFGYKGSGAYRIERRVEFEVPLNMAMPGTFPQSSLPLDGTEMFEEGRFIGWMASPDVPEDGGTFDPSNVNLAASPLFLPAKFSVDEENWMKGRESPEDPLVTTTTSAKGSGTVFMSVSGMLICDLKKMACDLNNILFNYQDGKETIAVTTTSDAPGSETEHETRPPSLTLPGLLPDAMGRLSAFPLTLPLPSVLTFSAPASPGEGAMASTVTYKVTLSAEPAAKGNAKPR